MGIACQHHANLLLQRHLKRSSTRGCTMASSHPMWAVAICYAVSSGGSIQHAQQLGVHGGSDGTFAFIATKNASFQQELAIITNEEKALKKCCASVMMSLERRCPRHGVLIRCCPAQILFGSTIPTASRSSSLSCFVKEMDSTVNVEGYKAHMKDHK
ncbi:hypothetical protein KXD40_008643 [Peronospora effusa]|uniref:Uncharacterized protein n=1 Tax=Peronospora effusa TaxID=542832 RepID=A0A3M6VD14_9STRA|nr:hypothetical protein DD238_004303 [Peronospora effusa]UIZ24558.1 hypothetical protein KXD40_008643 [Peronospora effusa]